MARNGIYEKLTADPDDLVGILAYIAYKQHKIEFCQITANGNPSREQIEQFQAVAAMETKVGLHTPDAEDSALQSADTRKPIGPRTGRTRADSGQTQQ